MPRTDLPSPEQAADDIFLSPRVIDSSSLDALEARLRAVIDHALETGQALVSLDEESKASLKALKQAGPALDTRSRNAAKLLQTLDQRVSDAEGLLGRAIERADRAEHFEGDVDAIVARAEEKLQLRVDAIVADGEQRLEQAEQGLRRRIDELSAQAKEAITAHAADARRDAEAHWSRLADSTREAEAAARALGGRLASLRREADEIREPLHDLCARAERLVADGDMATLVSRAERMGEQASGAVERFEHVREQTEQARKLLAQALAQSSTRLDELSDKQSGLHRDIKESSRLCDEAAEAMTARADQLRAALRAPLDDAGAEARRLADLIARGQATASKAGEAMRRHEETMARLEEAMARLEPWRGTMLEGRSDLPAPLRSVVNEFRVEIGRSVGQIADGLKTIADRQ